MALAGFLIPIFLGWTIVDLATRGHAASRSLVMRSALAVGAGFGCSSMIGFIFLLAGVPRAERFVELLAACGFAILARQAGRRERSVGPLVRQEFPLAILAMAVAASTGTFIVGSIGNLYGQWDAWAMWMLRARFIDLLGPDWGRWFAGPGHSQFDHSDYPFLLPTVVGSAWRDAGSESPIISHTITGLFAVVVVALLFAAVDHFVGQIAAVVASVVLLSLFDFALLASWLYADVPFAYYVLASVVLLVMTSIAEPSPGVLFLAGLMAGLSAWTKNEGWALLLGSLLALAVLSHIQPAVRRKALWFPAGVVPPLLVILFFKIRYAGTNDLIDGQGRVRTLARLADPSRYVTIARSVIFYFLSHRVFLLSLLIGLLLLGMKWSWAATRETLAGSIVIVTMMAIYALAYVTTPNDLKWQLTTSFPRLALHLWPSVLFVLMFGLSRREAMP